MRLFERPAYARADDPGAPRECDGEPIPPIGPETKTLVLYHEGYPETGFDLSLFDVTTKKATNLMPVK